MSQPKTPPTGGEKRPIDTIHEQNERWRQNGGRLSLTTPNDLKSIKPSWRLSMASDKSKPTAFTLGSRVLVRLETENDWSNSATRLRVRRRIPATLGRHQYTGAYHIKFDAVGRLREHTCIAYLRDLELIS